MKNILLLLSLVFTTTLFAQTGTIRGFVYEKESGEPVMFCNVFLKGTTIGAPTDINGMYNIPKVKQGTYILVATYIGYDTTEVSISLNTGKILTQNLEIIESSIKLNEVKISAERAEMKTEVKAAAIKISKQDLKMIPTIGGEPDLAQYMQIIPGVVFTGDQGGQLYIRGGSPIQNKVLMDGMTIYSPFHSIGLFSVFDTDIIRNTDVYTGGFSAEYGGRVSSIMDIKTIDGNKKEIGGRLSGNTFGSKLFIEGPLSRSGNTSFIFSGKTSYLDKSSDLIYKYPTLYFDKKGLPYSYTDIYGKFSSKGNNGSKVSLFGFNFEDNVNYKGITDLNWDSKGIGSEFVLIPSGSPVLIEGNIAYSSYNTSLEEFNEENDSRIRISGINGFDMGFDFTYFQPKGKIKYGFDVHGFSTNYLTYNSVNQEVTDKQSTSEFSAYVNYQFRTTRWILEPGFRLQRYTLGLSPEPRLGIKYIASERMRFKLSAGLYSQNILSTTSDKDVVSLFTGIISSPEDIPDDKNGDPYKQKFQKARHLISGIEYDVSNAIDFQIEGYIKDFNQLTNINRNMTSNTDDQFIIESGIAKGVDLLLKYKKQKLYIWAVYSLGMITRTDGENTYHPHFDRRHNVNLVTSYKFGRNESWKADIRWNLGSGFPFTQTQGFYENLTFSDGISTDYTNINGELEIEYAELNKGRLPYYHRLDASISKRIKLRNKIEMEINTSITNTYNRENIFYFNRVKGERVNQLPIMPSIGASITF
ncbi:MAG: TonB-dependent receptor [Flavobacteriales bacterium]|nr:TonB-dependent receptor [Flavobacteriales bacterium]|tara:strand:- start:11885 stop:14149 length:2265 start_codon:yes stop_codon:yes gene_type:complete